MGVKGIEDDWWKGRVGELTSLEENWLLVRKYV